jgi:hypothetical protein
VVDGERQRKIEVKTWPAGHPLPVSPFSPPLLSPLPQPPPLWEIMDGLWPHGLPVRPPPLAAPATPWLPYIRVAKGSLLLHPTSSKAISNFLNPSPSSKFA